MIYKRKVHAGIYYDCDGKLNDINSNSKNFVYSVAYY